MDDDRHEEKFENKAIIIGDSFSKHIYPISDELPEILLPIGNIPVIEYLLYFLTSNNINENYLIITKHCNEVEQYINKYHRNKLTVIRAENARSVADCLREIHRKNYINSDFVLISSPLIANFNIEKIYNIHLLKKKEDKSCIMTMILKKYTNTLNKITKHDNAIIALDKTTNQILQYEDFNDNAYVELNNNLNFSKGKDLKSSIYTVRYDLFDSLISICSLDVISHFNENFDYHNIRNDLMKNIICSEIFSDKFYAFELETEDYVSPIRNTEGFIQSTKDIINRWAYPMVLDSKQLTSKIDVNFKYSIFNVYLDERVEIDFSSSIENESVVGKGSIIQKETKIEKSVIGRNVTIGPKCSINNCIIFDDCVIKEGCTLENVIILNNSNIMKDSVTIKNSTIGKDVCLDYQTSISKSFVTRDEDGEIKITPKKDYFADIDEEDIENSVMSNEESVPEEEFTASEVDSEQDEDVFEEEIEKTILNGIENGKEVQNIVVEINSLKISFYKECFETVKVCIPVILNHYFDEESIFNDSSRLINTLKEVFENWKVLFFKLITNDEDKSELLNFLMEFCLNNSNFKQIFQLIIQMVCLYEIVPQKLVLNWINEREEEHEFKQQFSKLSQILK